jgi:hypothetical protein
MDLIEEYENKSYYICEECGKPGKYRGDLGWKLTLCDNHYKKELKRQKRWDNDETNM